MLLKYNLDEILLKQEQKLSEKAINNSFHKLMENDFSIIPQNVMEPQIWECKWYNNPSIEGYKTGDVCWLNTESIDEFILNNHKKIYDYAINNTHLIYKIKPYEFNNSEIHDLYKQIVMGYKDYSKNIQLEPIFELGNIKDKVQIRISKIDNNKHSIYENEYWDDFFVRDDVNYDSKLIFNKIIDKHLTDYHLSNECISLDEYADISLSNISTVQEIHKHVCDYHKENRTGLDYITDEKLQYNFLYNIVSEISTTTQNVVSKNQYVLTGDIVYILNNSLSREEFNKKLNKTVNYGFIYQFLSGDANKDIGIGNIALELAPSESNPIIGTSFPNYFKYTNELYEKISDNISNYRIREYCIGELTTKTPPSEISNYYTIGTPLSVDDITTISPELRKLYKRNEVADIQKETTVLENFYNIREKWVKRFKSGYVIQGGYVEIRNQIQDSIITIPLIQPFDYVTTQKSIYGDIISITEELQYTNNNTLTNNDKYTVSITPVSDKFEEDDIIEIIGLRNDSFDVCISRNSPRKFFYTVQGIIYYD